MGEPVVLQIYDISRGLARTMSQSLIGIQLEGIWHTGILFAGREYYFGSMGIDSCPPNGTILGAPNKTELLGHSELPVEIVDEWIADARDSRFAGHRYHLLDHNCNNFSDEFATFLTGNNIPSHIVELPAIVRSTPMGQQLLQLISSFDPMQRR